MIRSLAAILALVLIFCSGCAIQLEDTPMPNPAPMPVPNELDLVPRIEIEAALYFLNRTRSKLEIETRTLHIEQNTSPELAIVQAMLDGPSDEDLYPVAAGFSAERVEVMPDLINVYLRQTVPVVRQWDLAALKLALTAALIDYSGVRYVNLLVNGMETGFEVEGSGRPPVPLGACARPGDLDDEISTLIQKAAASSYDAYAALYFLDPSESWLLPEVVRVSITPDGDIVQDVLDALLRGPGSVYSLRRSLDSGLELLEHEFVENESGNRVLRMVFNRMPTVYTSSFVDGEQMAAAALAYTFTDFVPGITGIELTDRVNPARVVACTPTQFADLVGNRIVVYLPNTPSGTTMAGIERVVPQAQSSDLYTILSALFRGPTDGDGRNVWPAAPDGISVKSVLDVYRAGDVIVVNFDGAVSGALEQTSTQDERILLFSIVNTLTNMKGVRSVLFLKEGERVEYLGSGPICVLDPIMKNPGIVR